MGAVLAAALRGCFGAGLTVVVLTLTVVGIPFAIERSVRWALVPQVCLLGNRDEGPLRQSVRVTRGNWWRTFALTSVMNLPAVTLALLVGTAVLLLIPAAPIYVVALTSSCVFAFTYPYVGSRRRFCTSTSCKASRRTSRAWSRPQYPERRGG